MFKELKLVAFCSLFVFSGLSWGVDYGKASKIESARQGDIVVRYIKEYGSSCLIVQVLDPAKDWSILGDKKFCSYGSKSLMTDVSYASFEKITFSPDGIHFNLSVTPLALSEDELHVCFIPIKGAEIKDLECPDLKK